jgi:hypothetical protein
VDLFEKDFAHPIDKITMFPYSTFVDVNGPLPDWNLRPKYIFRVEYVYPRSNTGQFMVLLFYPIGKKDDEFLFVYSSRPPLSTAHFR